MNFSGREYLTEDGGIRVPLHLIVGVGPGAVERIFAARGVRPFTSRHDFARRTHLPRKVLATLAEAGAFEGLPPAKPEEGIAFLLTTLDEHSTISPSSDTEARMKQLLKVMKALGDGTRVKIFKLLQQRSLCVCELTSVLGLSQSAVSKNLKLLEDAGLVAFERQGPWINYRLAAEANTYAAAIASHFHEWLDDDPAIRNLLAKADSVDRLTVCKRQSVARPQKSTASPVRGAARSRTKRAG